MQIKRDIEAMHLMASQLGPKLTDTIENHGYAMIEGYLSLAHLAAARQEYAAWMRDQPLRAQG